MPLYVAQKQLIWIEYTKIYSQYIYRQEDGRVLIWSEFEAPLFKLRSDEG